MSAHHHCKERAPFPSCTPWVECRLQLLPVYQGSGVQRVNQFSSLKWHGNGNFSACIVSLGSFFPCDYSHVVIKGMEWLMSVDGGERKDE